MLDKNGKKVSKPKAKKMLAYALARSCIKNNFASIKLDEVQKVIDEYGFSRKSIHDTIVANYSPSDEKLRREYYENIHTFCFTRLRSAK